MGLHVDDDQSSNGVFGTNSHQQTGVWGYIIHSERYLALTLGLPYGSVENWELPVSPVAEGLGEKQQDMRYLKKLDRIATRIIDREQSSQSLAFAATQSISDALEDLAQSVPRTWWQDIDRIHNVEGEALSDIYFRLNVQLWHHQLLLALQLPFLLDSTAQRRYEYNRFSCLSAARDLIKKYLVIRTTYGMFSCCLTNFQAFTAAAILVFNLFMPNPTLEREDLSGQKEADWALISNLINSLDQSTERFRDPVAAQASNALKLLRTITEDPQGQEGDGFSFTIPYFGTISITRRYVQ